MRTSDRIAKAWGTHQAEPPATDEERERVVRLLRNAADAIEGQNSATEPFACIVGLIGASDVEILRAGGRSWDYVHEVARQVHEHAHVGARPSRTTFADRGPVGAITRICEKRTRQGVRERQYLADHPFPCPGEICFRRFRTERGLNQHLRRSRLCRPGAHEEAR